MKNVTLIFLTSLILNSFMSQAQNKTFGVGTSALNPNAALQVDAPSGNQGLQLPRLTTAQRTAMTLSATDKGLMVFDTNLNSIHTWNGTAWSNGQKLQFPYKDSLTVDPAVGDAFFHLVNTSNQANADVIKGIMKGTGGAAGSFILRNAASTKPALYGETIGTGNAAFFKVNNAAAGGTAIWGSTNSNVGGALAPVGVYGESTGTGSVGGAFWNTNATNTYPALYSQTNGTGPALVANQNGASGEIAIFKNNNAAVATIYKDGSIYNFSTNSWAAFQAANSGDGFAGAFWIDKVTSANSAIYAETHGTGISIQGETTTGWTAIKGTNYGTGNGGYFSVDNPSNSNPALHAETNGTSSGGHFAINNGSSSGAGIYGTTNGTGSGVTGQTASGFAGVYARNEGSGGAGLQADHVGTNGSAGSFNVSNASNSAPAVFASSVGTGAVVQGTTSSGYAAINGQHNGASNGFGGLFEVMNAANTYQAVKATTLGAGNAAFFEINNSVNNTPAVQSMTNGTGAAGDFQITNTSSGSTALYAKTTGSGTAIDGVNSGTGTAGHFYITNPANNSSALLVNTNGTGGGGSFQINNSSNIQEPLNSLTNGVGNAFAAINTGTGRAGYFGITNGASSANGILAETNGTGTVLFTNHTGASGNIAVFQSASTNVARIDKTGKGFFNGGTQASGADVAELFDVEGDKQDYEPGDVLVISESTDRTVEKSALSNSTKVIGVYATKPGVTLTEKGMDENIDDLVPMGVIGVIPTKVCDENGPIKRGDLLVTSSRKGHAMKASMITINGVSFYPSGIILGKALEDFDNGAGMINVFVNVK